MCIRDRPSAAQILERMDRNDDQQISKSEAQGRLVEDFDRLDKDSNGFLSIAELNVKPPRKKN